MSRKSGTRKGGRRGPDWRTNRLLKKSRPGKPGLRQRTRRQKILAAAAALLVLLITCSILPRRSAIRQPLPPDEPPAGEYVEEADKNSSLHFFELLLGHEIPGLEPPAADGRARIHALLCTALYTFTGIDPGNPCSVLDLELGAGMGVSLPAVTPSPSTGSGNGALPESNPDGTNSESLPWGGSLFPFPVSGYDEAKILLYHSHASESFTSGAAAAPGAKPTIVTAGEELARILEESYGLPVLHHRGVYDLPRRHAYTKARPAIEKIIAENSGIELVIDLHRDGVIRSKTTASMEGRELAKILLVHGLRNPEAEKNLEFVLCLRRELEAVASPLSRGIMQQDFIYNQDLHSYAILLELGGHENSIDEAIRSLPYLAEAIARTYYIFFLQD